MTATRRVARNDRGSTTVETALALASFVLLLTLALYALAAAVDQVRCVDAAREAARLAARGEPDKEATDVARRIAPPNADITITKDGDDIRVVVKAPAGALLPGLELTADAFAMSEPGP